MTVGRRRLRAFDRVVVGHGSAEEPLSSLASLGMRAKIFFHTL